MVLLTAPQPLPSMAPHPRQHCPPDPPGCAWWPVPSPRPVLSPSAASGHLACRPRSAGCSSQMRLACLQKQVPLTATTPGPAQPQLSWGAAPGLLGPAWFLHPIPDPIKLGASKGQVREDEGCCLTSSPRLLLPLPSPSGVSQGRRAGRGRQTGLKILPCSVSLSSSPANLLGGANRRYTLPLLLPLNP